MMTATMAKLGLAKVLVETAPAMMMAAASGEEKRPCWVNGTPFPQKLLAAFFNHLGGAYD